MKKTILFLLVSILFLNSCTQPEKKATGLVLPDIAVKSADFETVVNGKDVKLFNLKNDNGMIVQVTNFGASIVSVLLPYDDNNYMDVALGYNAIEGYMCERFYLC